MLYNWEIQLQTVMRTTAKASNYQSEKIALYMETFIYRIKN